MKNNITGERIAQELHDQMMSKKDLADALWGERSNNAYAVQRWITGEIRPRKGTLERIAAVLEVDVEYLQGKTDLRSKKDLDPDDQLLFDADPEELRQMARPLSEFITSRGPEMKELSQTMRSVIQEWYKDDPMLPLVTEVLPRLGISYSDLKHDLMEHGFTEKKAKKMIDEYLRNCLTLIESNADRLRNRYEKNYID